VALLPLLAVEKIEEAKLKEEGKKRYWDAGKSFLATTMVLISCLLVYFKASPGALLNIGSVLRPGSEPSVLPNSFTMLSPTPSSTWEPAAGDTAPEGPAAGGTAPEGPPPKPPVPGPATPPLGPASRPDGTLSSPPPPS